MSNAIAHHPICSNSATLRSKRFGPHKQIRVDERKIISLALHLLVRANARQGGSTDNGCCYALGLSATGYGDGEIRSCFIENREDGSIHTLKIENDQDRGDIMHAVQRLHTLLSEPGRTGTPYFLQAEVKLAALSQHQVIALEGLSPEMPIR